MLILNRVEALCQIAYDIWNSDQPTSAKNSRPLLVPRLVNGETAVVQLAVATPIVASLEGALMMSRLQRRDEALLQVQMHLNRYLDNEVA